MQPTQSSEQPGGQGFYVPSGPQLEAGYKEGPQPTAHKQNSIEWEASEYVHHDKGAGWVVALSAIALIGVGVSVWLSQWLFAVLVVLMAVAFGVVGLRKPRILKYKLTPESVTIDGRYHALSDFRAFAVVPDGAVYYVTLLPVKRFAPAVTIYFAESDGEAIVDILGAYLPMEKIALDPIDIVMRKLRF